ncbi:hypothetical protein ACOSP7_024318 [Xanthoceras sorbifolium]
MSSASWITSLSCSSSVIQSSADTSVPLIFQWLRFIFLSPCPQRALLSFVDVVFLLTLIVLAVQMHSTQTVGHWFHPNHDGHNLSKKRTDHDFSVQNIGDVNFHRYKPFQLLAGISATTKRIYVEGSFVEPEYRLLPNHHIINVSENISVEMKSQLLPNQHLSSNAEDRLCCKRPFFRGITSGSCGVGCTHWLQWAGS